ncbi:MAG: hypothetical protein QOE90_54 [Thermoplasmata archaeon]|jgi:hypothetical protein|nr:hypothetical protein [Thermoplasmata archaeon]
MFEETEAERAMRLQGTSGPASGRTLATDRDITTQASDRLDWVRAGLGVFGLFVALGVAVAILAYSAAFALKSVNLNDPAQAALVGAAGLVALLPLVGAPLLATLGGFWAGTRTRNAGEGALGGALGTLFGLFALAILTAIGYAIGANAAGVDLARVNWPVGLYWRPGWGSTVGYFGTSAGILFLVACVLASAIAAAVAGALYARRVQETAYPTRRVYGRMPRV